MPTYQYECGGCGKTHEEFQGINDPPLVKCPHCGRKKLKRIIGAGAGLIFKGSGFYITDYRSKEYSEKAKSEGSTAPAKSDGKAGSDSSKASSGSKPAK
jgi:putative FmdB family regulatory protein